MNNRKVRLWDHWLPKVLVKPFLAFSSRATLNLKMRDSRAHIPVQFFLPIQNWVENNKSLIALDLLWSRSEHD